MANIIEISVTAKNLTKPAFDAAVADARAMGTKVGEQYSESMTDKVTKDLPQKIKEPLAKTKETARDAGVDAGDAFSNGLGTKLKALEPQVSSIMAGQGKIAGSGFAAKFGEQAKIGLTQGALLNALGPDVTDALAKTAGDRSGFNFTEAMGGRVRGELPKDVEQPLEDSGKKAGTAAGKAAGGAISPLIIGAFAAAATVGPAAVLGATAVAVVGAGALITKGNQQLQESYAQLGQKAASAIQDAAAPLIPELYSSVQVLERGVAAVGPELKSVFAAVAPDVTAITGGLVSLVSNTLPGVASGLRAIAPFAQDIAIDFGKLGSGLGGFFGALGSGASGGMAGFNALIDVTQALLVDIGKLAAGLAGGLGPALHDVANVAIPVVNALTDVVAAFPPHTIEAAALATAALFGAFKLGSIAGVVAEGTSFLRFLVATPAAEAAVVAETEATSVAMRGLGLAADAALGPLGLIAGAVTLYGLQTTFATGSFASFTDRLKAAVAAQQQQKQATVEAAQAQQTATAELNNTLATNQIQLAGAAEKAGENAQAALSFAGAQGGLNDAVVAAIGDFNLASGASSAYKTALDALYGKYQSYSDAQATFTKDLDNAAKGLKASKDGFDVNTQAGAANYQLMSTLATANENRAEALLKETGSQDKANQSLQQGAVAIDNLARQAGFGKADIDKLNLALYGTKNIGDIKVTVGTDTSQAYAQLRRLVNDINGSAAYVQVGVSGSGAVGGRQLLAHGGVAGAGFVSHAAAGGPRSNLTWVGEHGPELLPLPPGTTVHSNPDSMRMAAEAAGRSGGWDGVVRLEVTGDDLIAQWIRNHVRVVAGNAKDSVQRAFGQNF